MVEEITEAVSEAVVHGLRAPFPWFGGKSRAAAVIWDYFGEVANYVEPFAGSMAVLLSRPTPPRIETVNDLDCYLANFWRAVQYDPEAVADYADWPVNEADLHARHLWLVKQTDFRERMRSDPEYFDARIAGWWVWGLSQWIGSGWCAVGSDPHAKRPHLAGRGNGVGIHKEGIADEVRVRQLTSEEGDPWLKRPHLADAGRGVHKDELAVPNQLPALSISGMGVHRSRPAMAGNDAGRGVCSKLPLLAGTMGTGVHRVGLGDDDDGERVTAKLPNVDARGGKGVHATSRRGSLVAWFEALADRLRRVRVACGDWARVVTPGVTDGHGITGVLLDPPYSGEVRTRNLYSNDSDDVGKKVRDWAIANGDNPKLRIALCGYEGEHEMDASWEKVEWSAVGGYGSAGEGRAKSNRHKERIWFSRYCLRGAKQMGLFGG